MKKVLIITYYWPPSGGGGVQRWLKFVKYLPNFGWTPIVITPENPDFEIQDRSLLHDISNETTVIKLPIWEPFGFYKRLFGKKAIQQQGVISSRNGSVINKLVLWIRGNIFIPDPRVFWVRPTVNYLTKYINNNPVDVIVTTGPPHSMHLIGLELKKRLGIKWVADFRDPWSKWDVLDQLKLSNKSRKHHERLEKSVLESADQILTVGKRLGERLRDLGAGEKVSVITNGYDQDDFLRTNPYNKDKFQITHVGLLNNGRNPVELWQLLDELCSEEKDFKNDLSVVLAGTIQESVIKTIIEYRNLASSVDIVNYISHEDVLMNYANSALLLLLINKTNNASWILPGKLFEYMMAKKPILALGETESDANDLLTLSGFDPILPYHDKVGIKARVLSAYRDFKNNSGAAAGLSVEQFNREALTKDLSVLLAEIHS
jgi:glycosyltransferase involved in cell wall biosynthesis